MRVAMIGQKGIPATHGGVERHVEELAAHLVERGHEVTVFVRPTYTRPGSGVYRGVRLVTLPTIGTKHLDAIVHSIICSLYCWTGGYDVVHYHAVGPALASPIAKLRGRSVVTTIHAQDWLQEKWGRFAKSALRAGEFMALTVADRTIVVSPALKDSYSDSGRRVEYIPNGVSLEPASDTSVLAEFGLVAGDYGLFVGRLIPDKGVHELAAAWRASGLAKPLVIVGDAAFTGDYARMLREDYSDVCVFTGFVFGPRLSALFRSCGLFVLPSHLEGMPLVLLEALGYGAPIIASDIQQNVDVLGPSGVYFRVGDVEDLTRAIGDAWRSRDDLRQRNAVLAPGILAEHQWPAIAAKTEAVYRQVSTRL